MGGFEGDNLGKWLDLGSTCELKLHVTALAGDATVTISHRYTPKEQLKQHTIRADIVVAAAGETPTRTAQAKRTEGAALQLVWCF